CRPGNSSRRRSLLPRCTNASWKKSKLRGSWGPCRRARCAGQSWSSAHLACLSVLTRQVKCSPAAFLTSLTLFLTLSSSPLSEPALATHPLIVHSNALLPWLVVGWRRNWEFLPESSCLLTWFASSHSSIHALGSLWVCMCADMKVHSRYTLSHRNRKMKNGIFTWVFIMSSYLRSGEKVIFRLIMESCDPNKGGVPFQVLVLRAVCPKICSALEQVKYELP
ncbi:unnamed protein product, partial [Tetraodon nigroviridis]